MTPSPDLYALIIRLIASQNGRLRATQGHLAHAAFLSILQQADPAISQAIHDMPGRKPFTISPLEGFGTPHNGHIQINAGQEGWLRVTLLDPSSSKPSSATSCKEPTAPPSAWKITSSTSAKSSTPPAATPSPVTTTCKPFMKNGTRLPDYQTIRPSH
ncbi:MAG: hypothetical protein M5U34_37165 [Chloroflexi bacterium]|nr:hypothetical protein [Chloroflexota bacterium]